MEARLVRHTLLTVADATEKVLREAVANTAARITARGEELRRPFREKDLRLVFVDVLRVAVAESGLGATVERGEHSVKLAEWPGVGGVDVAILDQGQAPAVFVELKWGAELSTTACGIFRRWRSLSPAFTRLAPTWSRGRLRRNGAPPKGRSCSPLACATCLICSLTTITGGSFGGQMLRHIRCRCPGRSRLG
jgi:hypothetical protein